MIRRLILRWLFGTSMTTSVALGSPHQNPTTLVISINKKEINITEVSGVAPKEGVEVNE